MRIKSDPIKIIVDGKEVSEISFTGILVDRCKKCGKVHKEKELCEKDVQR